MGAYSVPGIVLIMFHELYLLHSTQPSEEAHVTLCFWQMKNTAGHFLWKQLFLS